MRVLMLFLLFTAVPSFAADRAAVAGLLTGYEWHLDAHAFGKLPPDTWQTLIAIANDPAETNFIRQRAMAALTLYPNNAVWTWFDARVASAKGAVRRRSVDALCAAFATRRGPAVEAAVSPLLQSTDAQLRVSAAKCLRQVGGSKAEAALSQYRAHIRHAWEARAAGFADSSP